MIFSKLILLKNLKDRSLANDNDNDRVKIMIIYATLFDQNKILQ